MPSHPISCPIVQYRPWSIVGWWLSFDLLVLGLLSSTHCMASLLLNTHVVLSWRFSWLAPQLLVSLALFPVNTYCGWHCTSIDPWAWLEWESEGCAGHEFTGVVVDISAGDSLQQLIDAQLWVARSALFHCYLTWWRFPQCQDCTLLPLISMLSLAETSVSGSTSNPLLVHSLPATDIVQPLYPSGLSSSNGTKPVLMKEIEILHPVILPRGKAGRKW